LEPSGSLKPSKSRILSPAVAGAGAHGEATASPSRAGVAGGLASGHGSHSSPMPSLSSSWAPPAACSQKSLPFGMPSPSRSPVAEMQVGPAGLVRSQLAPAPQSGLATVQVPPVVIAPSQANSSASRA